MAAFAGTHKIRWVPAFFRRVGYSTKMDACEIRRNLLANHLAHGIN